MPKIQIVLFKKPISSGNDSDLLTKHFYANGLGSTTGCESSKELTYEEMFQRRVQNAKYREQKIPQSAIKNLVVRELDECLSKSFKKHMSSTGLTSSQQASELNIHQGTLCDNCGISPIIGNRYSCMLCPTYDLCEYCENQNPHVLSHPMIKVKQFTEMSKKIDKNKIEIEIHEKQTQTDFLI